MTTSPIKLMITGRTGSGMTLACAHLAEQYEAVCWSRSELMKQIAHALADGVGDLETLLARVFPVAELRAEVREELLDWLSHYQPESSPIRLYQEVVEICQRHEPLCFETELEARIKAAGKQPFIVIDDIKGDEEGAFAYFSERGYASLRIEAPAEARAHRLLTRDGALPQSERLHHPVETGLDTARHDFVVDNDTSEQRFTARIDRVVELLRSGAFTRGGAERIEL